MKKMKLLFYVLVPILVLTACDPIPSGAYIPSPTEMKTIIVAGTELAFPYGLYDLDDAKVTESFSIAEAEVTNGLAVRILQYALDSNAYIYEGTATDSDVNSTTVEYRGHELVDLDNSACRINYDEDTDTFTVDAGYENHPLICVTWYGAVMMCNWLTVLEDNGSGLNSVYYGMDPGWDSTDVQIHADRTGYRLPTIEEWECAARYMGKTEPSYSDPSEIYWLSGNNNGDWTDGYFWTPGDFASGATADFSTHVNCSPYSVYGGSYTEAAAVGTKRPNYLGLYDQSGNAEEWCFTVDSAHSPARFCHGGNWSFPRSALQIGNLYYRDPATINNYTGFRFCKSVKTP